jgi:hypothetical protein
MGPCNRIETRHRTCEGAEYPLVSSGTDRIGSVHYRTCGNRTYSPLEFAMGFSLLLHEKEGWETTTRSGLSEVELSYHQEPVSSALDLGDHAHAL